MSKIITPQFLLRLSKGRYSPRESWRSLHHHPEWQWDYLHQGAMSVRMENRTVRLRPREAILLPPELSHGLAWHEDCVYSSFKFHWPGAPAAISPEPIHWLGGDLNPALLQGLLTSAAVVDDSGAEESGCWLHLLLSEALRAQAAAEPRAPVSLADQIETRLAAGGFQPVSLNQMARDCHLSTAQFLRRFHQATGTTPAKYVLRLRLDRAEALLRYGDMNVSQVAQALGWPDVFSFSKAWKRYRGISPRASLRAEAATPI